MKYEQYAEMAENLLKDNTKAPLILKDLLDNLKVDLDAEDTKEKRIGELDQKVRDLQDTNMKLFLNQIGKSQEKEEEPRNEMDELMDELLKGED